MTHKHRTAKHRRNAAWEDPVVAEVRAIRQKLWRQAGGTFAGLLRLLDEKVPAARKRSARRRRSGISRRRAS